MVKGQQAIQTAMNMHERHSEKSKELAGTAKLMEKDALDTGKKAVSDPQETLEKEKSLKTKDSKY